MVTAKLGALEEKRESGSNTKPVLVPVHLNCTVWPAVTVKVKVLETETTSLLLKVESTKVLPGTAVPLPGSHA